MRTISDVLENLEKDGLVVNVVTQGVCIDEYLVPLDTCSLLVFHLSFEHRHESILKAVDHQEERVATTFSSYRGLKTRLKLSVVILKFLS